MPRPTTFSRSQFDEMEQRAAAQEIPVVLRRWSQEVTPIDPVLAAEFSSYAQSDDHSLVQRIADLTDIDAYQRQILGLSLQSGMDFTTHPAFAYLMEQPYMTGNTKARHIILMATAFSTGG